MRGVLGWSSVGMVGAVDIFVVRIIHQLVESYIGEDISMFQRTFTCDIQLEEPRNASPGLHFRRRETMKNRADKWYGQTF